MAIPFDDDLRLRLRDNLAGFERLTVPEDGGAGAAVALVVLPDARGEANLLLTQRAAGLRRHSGQWACPGGRRDAGETAEETALRELAEEVGLDLPSSHVLGCLDDYPTRSGFVITPVAIWGAEGAQLRPDPREVASIHLLPVSDLLRPESVVTHAISQSDRPVLALAILGTLIYAPTAAVLHQFAEVAVLGRATRVAHYEQPLFAWR
ncbi:MAG TPA: CoA pyrophosphatase [Thermoanaerobaculia bacterium]